MTPEQISHINSASGTEGHNCSQETVNGDIQHLDPNTRYFLEQILHSRYPCKLSKGTSFADIPVLANSFSLPVSPVASPGGSDSKESPANAGDTGDVGLIPELGRSPGERNGNPPQYSCRGNPINSSLAGYRPWGRRVRYD